MNQIMPCTTLPGGGAQGVVLTIPGQRETEIGCDTQRKDCNNLHTPANKQDVLPLSLSDHLGSQQSENLQLNYHNMVVK